MASRRSSEKMGTCQFCFRTQVVSPRGGLVFHGYRRTGHGSTVGECMGVGAAAYQESCNLIIFIRDKSIETLSAQNKYLVDLEADRYEYFLVADRNKPLYDDYTKRRYGYELKEVHRDSDDSLERYEYKQELRRHIDETRQYIARLIASIDMRTKQIENWKLKPLLDRPQEDIDRERVKPMAGLSSSVSTLIRKMAQGLKSDMPKSVKREAFSVLGWKFRDGQPALKKIGDPDVLHKLLKEQYLAPFGATMWGYGGVKELKYIWVYDEQKARECHANLIASSSPSSELRIGQAPNVNAPDGTLFIKEMGVPIEDSRWSGRDGQKRWTIAIKDPVIVVINTILLAPNGDEVIFDGDRVWTFAYKHGLKEQAAAYVREHTTQTDSNDALLEILAPEAPDLNLPPLT